HVGGRLGSGRQWMSWVHVDDVVGIMTMAIDTPGASVRSTPVSPEPVHEADVAAAIGRALGRRSWLPVPALPIRLVLRDVSVLILGSVRAIPTRAAALGYRFRWTDLDAAMRDVLRSARCGRSAAGGAKDRADRDEERVVRVDGDLARVDRPVAR